MVFIAEIVPRRAIALIARLAYNENYLAYPMAHDIARRGDTAHEFHNDVHIRREHLVDVLRPFLERHLDAKCLVYGEGHVEEI